MPASPVLPKLVGQRVKRREDPRLIQGRATYVDDIALVGMQHVAFKRSDIAHGKIRKIDTSAAAAMDGVEAVYTGADIAKMLPPMPIGTPFPRPNIARWQSTSFGSAASRLRSSWRAIATSRETRLMRSSLITIRCGRGGRRAGDDRQAGGDSPGLREQLAVPSYRAAPASRLTAKWTTAR
jgi:hypothetical protein